MGPGVPSEGGVVVGGLCALSGPHRNPRLVQVLWAWSLNVLVLILELNFVVPGAGCMLGTGTGHVIGTGHMIGTGTGHVIGTGHVVGTGNVTSPDSPRPLCCCWVCGHISRGRGLVGVGLLESRWQMLRVSVSGTRLDVIVLMMQLGGATFKPGVGMFAGGPTLMLRGLMSAGGPTLMLLRGLRSDDLVRGHSIHMNNFS